MIPSVDPELQSWIIPLKPEEYSDLEKSILADGCREAIRQRVELMDWIAKRDRSYTATLEPFDSLDGVIDASRDDIVEADK